MLKKEELIKDLKLFFTINNNIFEIIFSQGDLQFI